MKEMGYFSTPNQDKPAYDPGLNVQCLVCGQPLSLPVKTISFRADDNRSYFYRLHKACATEENQKKIEGPLVEAIHDMQKIGNTTQWGNA